MAQHYSNPERANEFGALPDVETFYVERPIYGSEYCHPDCGPVTAVDDHGHIHTNVDGGCRHSNEETKGWYWQPCFPGCLPDGDPNGPFATEAEALADAREGVTDDDDGDDDDASDEGFESSCSECCAEDGFTHVVTLRPKSRCVACGYNSHHYPARVYVDSDGEAYAHAIYSGADDPAGNFPDVDVSDCGFAQDDEVLISWCCGAAKPNDDSNSKEE